MSVAVGPKVHVVFASPASSSQKLRTSPIRMVVVDGPGHAGVGLEGQLFDTGDADADVDHRAGAGEDAAVEEDFSVADDLEIDCPLACGFIVDADVGDKGAVVAVGVVDDGRGGMGADAFVVDHAAEREGISLDALVEL